MNINFNSAIKIVLSTKSHELESYYDLYIYDILDETYKFFCNITDFQLSLLLPVEVRQFIRDNKDAYVIMQSLSSFQINRGDYNAS